MCTQFSSFRVLSVERATRTVIYPAIPPKSIGFKAIASKEINGKRCVSRAARFSPRSEFSFAYPLLSSPFSSFFLLGKFSGEENALAKFHSIDSTFRTLSILFSQILIKLLRDSNEIQKSPNVKYTTL